MTQPFETLPSSFSFPSPSSLLPLLSQISVEKSEDGTQAQVRYRIEEGGKYELSIKWFGEHIKVGLKIHRRGFRRFFRPRSLPPCEQTAALCVVTKRAFLHSHCTFKAMRTDERVTRLNQCTARVSRSFAITD